MKKIVVILVILVLALCLVGCREEPVKEIPTKNILTTQSSATTEPITPSEEQGAKKQAPQQLAPPYNKEEIAGIYKCKSCAMDEKCENGECVKITLERKNVCGNFVCEPGEEYDGYLFNLGMSTDPNPLLSYKRCYYDCPAPKVGFYNDYVDVKCACKEANENRLPSCAVRDIGKYGNCTNCGEQERIFDKVAEVQKETVKCLSDYFSFTPPLIRYYVYNMRSNEVCNQNECLVGPGGVSLSGRGVYFPGLMGVFRRGKNMVAEPEDYRADIHETTHHFVNLMIHGAPPWFHEAVAIQTNERLECKEIEQYYFNGREPYLPEVDYSPTAGTWFEGGPTINLGYWRELKQTGKPIPEKIHDTYFQATLLILALRDEYGCGSECFRDIVIKLHELEQDACMKGDGKDCFVTPTAFSQNNIISYEDWASSEKQELREKQFFRIKKVIDERVNDDTGWIFNLLAINEKSTEP